MWCMTKEHDSLFLFLLRTRCFTLLLSSKWDFAALPIKTWKLFLLSLNLTCLCDEAEMTLSVWSLGCMVLLQLSLLDIRTHLGYQLEDERLRGIEISQPNSGLPEAAWQLMADPGVSPAKTGKHCSAEPRPGRPLWAK